MFPCSTKREFRYFHGTRAAKKTKKCTKKRDARAKLLSRRCKPIAFLPFLLPSPSSLLKLPNERDVNWKGGYFVVTAMV